MSGVDVSISTVSDHEREMERQRRDSEYNRTHGIPDAPQPNPHPPATNNTSASTANGPPPKIHIRHDGNNLEIDPITYQQMDTQTICARLNEFCMMMDYAMFSDHHPIPLSTIEFYKPQPVPKPEEVKTETPPKDAIEPFYGVETALFASMATLKTLYETGVLIKNSIFENKSNGNLGNKLPIDKPDKMGHIFRDEPGHISNTPANQKLIENVCNDKNCYLGQDKYGTQWFAKDLDDGTQAWVQVRDNKVMNAGINRDPRTFNNETGLSNKDKPKPSFLFFGVPKHESHRETSLPRHVLLSRR